MRWLLCIFGVAAVAVAVIVAWPPGEAPPVSVVGRQAPPAADVARAEPGSAGSADAANPPDVAGVADVDRDAAAKTAAPAQPPIPPAPPDGPTVRGRVFAMDGAPVAGAFVAALPVVAGRVAAPARLPRGSPTALSDAQGRFEVRCHDDAPRDVVVKARGFAPTVRAEVQPGPATPELRVVLERGAVVSGHLTGPRLEKLAGVPIELWMEGAGTAQPERELGPGSVCAGGHFLGGATTDREGRFEFEDLPSGAAVVAVAPRHGNARAAVSLSAGSEHDVDLRLLELRTVRGRVANAAAMQQAMRVFLYGGTLLSRSAVPEVDGTFVFTDVPQGRYLIGALPEPIAEHLHAVVQEFEVSGQATLARTITVGRLPVPEIELPAPSARTGTVTGAAWIGGAAASGATVTLQPVDGVGARVRRATIGEDGSFRVLQVPGGHYDAKLWRRGDGEPIATQACRVTNGGAVHVTFAVQ